MAKLFSYKPNRKIYANKSVRVLSNKIVTFNNNKGWAFWVIKLYYKLINLKNYLKKGNKRSYILNISFVFDIKIYKFCWIIRIASLF